ncbi:oxidoreductase, partial [Escherichia coli]|nr:oxidoreductase [Escherichia coli]HCT3790191.1 oxidoreductase [Escherichia coli]
MMMILGMFPFSLQTTPYQSANKTNSWRHVKNDRVG